MSIYTDPGNRLLDLVRSGQLTNIGRENVLDHLRTLNNAPRMEPEVKDKWVGALRSGHFSQARGFLHRIKVVESSGVGHCCLGVLAVLDSHVEEKDDAFYYDATAFVFPAVGDAPEREERGSIPHTYARERYGLHDDAIAVLVELNDHGADFDLIADLIDTYL